MGGIVYAVAVVQPVQSWTVVRSHDDFQALADALAPVLTQPQGGRGGGTTTATTVGDGIFLDDDGDGLGCGETDPNSMVPEFPLPPEQPGAMVRVRNELQLWFSAMLMHPAVRESAAIRQFLTIGANTIPHQYEGVAWTQFNTLLPPQVATPSTMNTTTATSATTPASTSKSGIVGQIGAMDNVPSSSSIQFDMDMDYMFLGEEDDHDGCTPLHVHSNGKGHNHHYGNGDHDHPHHDDEDYIPPASERYKPTEEDVADEDEMDIMQFAGEVEMIDDIGSLAQSLGASHLGRSLQLQAERAHQGGIGGGGEIHTSQQQQQQHSRQQQQYSNGSFINQYHPMLSSSHAWFSH